MRNQDLTRTIGVICLASLGSMFGCEPPVEEATANAETTQQEPSTPTTESKSPSSSRDTPSLLQASSASDAKRSKEERSDSELTVTPSSTLKPANPLVPVSSQELERLNAQFANSLKPQANAPDIPEIKEQVIVARPAALDLGTFSTSEKGTGTVTLTNTGDEAVTISSAKASCGCTTSDFRNNTVLQPGETTDITVAMDGKGRARRLSKTVTFSINGYPPLRLGVVAETVAYVTLDVDPLTIDENGASVITLTSIDGQPFRVVSVLPAIAGDLSMESASTQQLTFDWDMFWDLVQTTKITIRLDHPLCNEITTNVRLSAEERRKLNELISIRRKGGELPTKDPTRPLTGDQLARYIKSGRGEQVLKYINDGLGKFDAVNRGGVALLSTAAEEGDADTVLGLLELGAELERVDRVLRTPLMYAARSKNTDVILIFLDAGADIRARDRLGNTPLSWAAGFGDADSVRALIEAGADANTVDTVLGYTPIVWASGFGDPESISFLIKAGADVNVHDTAEGRTPLMHAVRTGSVSGVVSLIGAGAHVNGIDNGKMTALHVGAGNNNVKLDKIKLLIEAGADVDALDSDGNTPLSLARTRTDEDGELIASYLSERTKNE